MTEYLSNWNLIDIITAVLLIGGTAYGYHRGFIRQLLSLTGFLFAYAAAFTLYGKLSPLLAATFPISAFQPAAQYEGLVHGLKLDTYMYNATAFALVFFTVKIGLSLIGHLLDWLSRVPGLNLLNRWSGALLALAEACIILILAYHVAPYIPSKAVQDTFAGSTAANYALTHTPEATAKLGEWFGKEWKP